MSELVTSDCPLCGAAGTIITEEFEGYVADWFSVILECRRCDLSFSSNRQIPENLYDSIYAVPQMIPGYDRYGRYADQVVAQADPLSWLAEAEGPYAVVEAHLATTAPGPILELGSGLGYLTHALRSRGYDAVGMDVSESAVHSARVRFGDEDAFFTPAQLSERRPDGFSLVIGLEVIEHVANPNDFLTQALQFCDRDGAVLLTTPNRDVSPVNVMWESDLPPVHLTWFGASSMEVLAARHGLNCSYVTPRNRFPRRSNATRDNLLSGPLLDEAGRPRGLAKYWDRRFIRWLDARPTAVDLGTKLGRTRIVGVPRRPDSPGGTGTTLGVVLKRS